MATLLALLGLYVPLVTLGYCLICLVCPWRACPRCRTHRRRHACRACNGTGMRPRLGWRIYTYLRRFHDNGTR
ncbi:hypothetical protein [Spongiactinospora sp. TRM90649]|uniref:hypothetical protein n=1 Tax=Spongiactinospora sp. TRM90649 TaxID=3031114 RepID=UPI0023F9D430|nr:hypothetical protein [Spongiactinospora sp. TRM90649]MDF5751954.1 hypothetical protein [Spongiactinospora sp. TRM90649]